jgi:methionine synthase I (cobalamin-dependent)/5,10-methylenetetrahydrofolate reductase
LGIQKHLTFIQKLYLNFFIKSRKIKKENLSMTDIREYLAHKPLLFDGGMGTYYKAAPGADCEMANLTDPEGVKKVHAEYLAAGAQAIKTNTFGLPRMAAAQMPGWEELAEAGWKLACDAAAEKDAAVFADLGPAPDTEAAPASSAYGLVAQQFAALGAKNFLFETLSSDVGIVEAVKALRVAVPDAFVMVSFAVLPDGYTREGLLFRDLLRRMEGSGVVDAVGLNCVSAPGAMKKLVQGLGETLLPLSVMPNAGYPVVTRARVLYQGKPAYFAREMGQIAAAGVRILGGCCGTTPAHIAALRAELDALPQQTEAAPAAKLSTGTAPAVEKDDAFLRKLNAGEKVIAIELDSPRVADLSGYLDGARRLQAAGADLLTIADCPIAQARMDSSLVACRVHRELGMCALPHMTCRDRNLNATKALLLGLYAEGVREVLAITGDPIPTAERDEVKNVYQFNSRKLAQYIVSLAGEGREMPSAMTVFGALNLNARNFDVELRRAVEKLENGMSGFLTQPVLSAQAVENLRKARQTLGERAKILAGIMPVVSQRNAIFMENEINGIHVAEDIIQRFAGLDREQGEALGLEVSMQMAREALPYADGFYLMTPFNRVALMERLIARLKTELLDAEG